MNYEIINNFPISNEEYNHLEREFGLLTKKASWQLLRKNTKNNHTDDFEDVNQELAISLIRAGAYFKRQVYIKKCLEVCNEYVNDYFLKIVLSKLESLWDDRKKHGANRQKFGRPQELILYKIMRKYVPTELRPNKNTPLEINEEFAVYCRAVAWNTQKSLGRKITKEKPLRTSMCSISEYDYLGTEVD